MVPPEEEKKSGSGSELDLPRNKRSRFGRELAEIARLAFESGNLDEFRRALEEDLGLEPGSELYKKALDAFTAYADERRAPSKL